MELVIRILYYLIIGCVISCAVEWVISSRRYQKNLTKIEAEDRELDKIAAEEQKVELNRKLLRFFYFSLAFLVVIDIVLMVPQVCEYLGFNYIFTVSVFTVIVVADAVLIYFLSGRIYYGGDTFFRINAFGKSKYYYKSDVKYVSGYGNKKVTTKHGTFTVFRAMSGSAAFIDYLNNK